MPVSFALLKKNGDELHLEDYCDFELYWEVEKKIWIKAGEYVLVPLVIGDLLSLPFDPVNDEEIPTIEYDFEEYPNPIYSSTLADIFWKTDMVLDWTLSAEELNNFG